MNDATGEEAKQMNSPALRDEIRLVEIRRVQPCPREGRDALFDAERLDGADGTRPELTTSPQ